MYFRVSLVTLFFLGIALVALPVHQHAQSESLQTSSQGSSQKPSPSPKPKEELPQDSDEVVRVETNLTNIFFTAADKSKRFVNTVKRDDIRIMEDGQAQEIFTFQQN